MVRSLDDEDVVTEYLARTDTMAANQASDAFDRIVSYIDALILAKQSVERRLYEAETEVGTLLAQLKTATEGQVDVIQVKDATIEQLASQLAQAQAVLFSIRKLAA